MAKSKVSRKVSSKVSRKVKRGSKVAKRVSRKRNSTKRKSGKNRKMNTFFIMMLAAKKAKEPSFVYNGKTYKRKEGKNGMVFYKKA